MESHSKNGPPSLSVVGERDWYPLSLEQHRFYAVERFSENVRSAAIPVGLEMNGPLRVDVLERCLPILVQRHPSLRTVIREVDGPVQVILSNPHVELAQHRLLDLDEAARQERITAFIQEDLKQPMDLQAGPLYRFILLQCAEDKHVLLIAFHHIVADFLSIGIFLDELSTIYCALLEGREPALRELKARYVDYSAWEKEFFSTDYVDTNLKFWREALKGHCAPLALPYDHSSAGQPAFGCLSEVLDFDTETQSAVSTFCRAQNLNKFVLYMAGLSAVLHGYTENERMVVGIPLGNRNFDETKPVIGTFANQSLAAIDLSGDPSFRDVFARLLVSLYNATTKVVPIIDVINILRKESGSRQRPLQVVLTYLKDVYRTNIPGVSSRPIKTGRDTLDVDLAFTVIKHAAGEALSIEYADSSFESRTIVDMLDRFKSVLDLIMSDPDKKLSEIFSANIFERKQTIQVASTFVAEPVERSVQFWMDELALRSKIQFCPQGQVFQQLVDPNSALRRNQDGYNVVLVRLTDWISKHVTSSSTADDVKAASAELDRNMFDFIAQLRQPFGVRTIVALTPDSPAQLANPAWQRVIARVQAQLKAEVASIQGVSLVTADHILSLYDLETFYDATQDSLGHIPYTDGFYVSLGTAIARQILALHTHQKHKVIVVDCDNTLWRGVVGEDGVHGIAIGEASRAFQTQLVRLQKSGMIVCLCSKNSERDVLDVFEKRTDMVLSLDHIVARKINWQLKSDNIRALALELNLGLDSFVFVDDNPSECAEVAASCPGVLCLQFPGTDDEIRKFVQHTWLFDRDAGTAEDDRRTQLYKENAEREHYRSSFDSYRTFIENLELSVEIDALQPADLARASQLTYRTNQFNTTTIRRSETELADLIEAGYGCSTVKVRDRFGDYGLVGVMLHTKDEDELVVDSLLLSCRALGKGVEHAMFASLGRLAAANKCGFIRVPIRPTAKNEPVRRSLEQIAGTYACTTDDGVDYVVPAAVMGAADFCAALEKQSPAADAPTDARANERSRPVHSHGRFFNTTWKKYGVLADVEKELGTSKPAAVREEKTRVLAVTSTEHKVAGICSEVIEVADLSVDDDIFELGGTSFDVVKIISRINEQFKISFDHHAFLRSPNVRDVAYQVDHFLRHGMFDDGLGAIDFDAEAQLPPDITAAGRTFAFVQTPRNILITGVTGFLGAHLLRELLDRTTATLHCHVRARSKDHGTARVIDNLKRYQIWRPEYRARISIVLGDLAEPRLGIENGEYERLSRETDIIYHNGSVVDFIKPYRALKDGNVKGTEEVLRLACSNRLTPVVYVSTVALFNSVSAGGAANQQRIEEEFVQQCDNPPLGGYAQSKWVAERLVTIAASRGLPVCIFRPGEIAGSSETGHLNESDILSVLFHAMIGMNSLPNLETIVDFIPVDLLSRMMVRIASSPESIGRVYNMVHPQPVGLSEYAKEVNALMPSVKLVPYREWTASLARYAEETNDDHIRSLMHLFTEEVPGQGKTWIESTASRGEVSVTNTMKYLSADELKDYRIDRALIGKYLSRIDRPTPQAAAN